MLFDASHACSVSIEEEKEKIYCYLYAQHIMYTTGHLSSSNIRIVLSLFDIKHQICNGIKVKYLPPQCSEVEVQITRKIKVFDNCI